MPSTDTYGSRCSVRDTFPPSMQWFTIDHINCSETVCKKCHDRHMGASA